MQEYILDRSPGHHREHTHSPTTSWEKYQPQPKSELNLELGSYCTTQRCRTYMKNLYLWLIFSGFMHLCVIFNKSLLSVFTDTPGEGSGGKNTFKTKKRKSGFYFPLLTSWLVYQANVGISKDTKALLPQLAPYQADCLSLPPSAQNPLQSQGHEW